VGVFNNMKTIEQILENTELIDTFGSRYGDKREVYRCNVEQDTYFITGKSRYSRGGCETDGTMVFADFEGGPFIGVNEVFLGYKCGNLGKVCHVEFVPLEVDSFLCVKFKIKK
jgi:hypothetical protein